MFVPLMVLAIDEFKNEKLVITRSSELFGFGGAGEGQLMKIPLNKIDAKVTQITLRINASILINSFISCGLFPM
jgi:hypothetical protein